MKNVKRRFMILCSSIFALMLISSSISVFAAEGNTWTTKAPMISARYYHQAVEVNGKIYAIGGYGSSGYLNSVEEYNPETNKWTTKASMADARCLHQAAVVDGKIYVIGGEGRSGGILSSVEEYDPVKDKWTTKASMSTARKYHQVVVAGGKIYVIGGENRNASINSVEEYDPAKDTWTTKASMNASRQYFQVAVVDGKIYAIGGFNGSSHLNSVEEYDPTKNTWTTKTPMAVVRDDFGAAVVAGKIYAIGGHGIDYLNSVEEYNPTTNAWVTKAAITTARCFFDTVEADGKIYAIGGRNNSGYLNSIEEYNPATNKWTTKALMTNARCYHQAVEVGGKIYAIDGYNGSPISSLEEYTLEYLAPTKLTTVADNKKVNLSWIASENAAGYNIKRSAVAGGSYTTIATSSAITYTDTTVTNGTTYYYVVTALNSSGESENSNEVSATPENLDVTLEVTSADKTKVGDLITANVVIHNAANICAEDIKVAFDTSKLEFVGAKNADGVKIYKEDSLTEGIRRYITASLGKANAANGDKVLLQLTFKAKAAGEAKIDITNGRIADNATLEKDIEEKNCGEKIVLIEEKSKDVNRSGEFTLLDLGIDAWYYGDAAANTDTSKYDADVVANGTIDDNDLSEIVKQMLSNANYPAASK